MTHAIEQSVRESHCALGTDRNHACMGQCTITPDGVKTACSLCGDGDETTMNERTGAYKFLTEIFGAAGVDLERLSVEAKVAAVDVYLRRKCPGCGRHARVYDDHHFTCECGDYRWESYFSNRGWVSRRKS